MKLAFCLFKYYPFGGLQRDFLRIARECVSRGHQVDVYTMEWEGQRDPNLNIHILPSTALRNHTRCKQFITSLQSYLQKNKYDRIVGFNKMPGLDIYYAADTCYLAKAFKLRSLWYRLSARFKHYSSWEKAVFEKTASTKILLIAANQQAEFMHYYSTPKARFYLLPPGIDKERITQWEKHPVRAEVRVEWNIKEEEQLILMIGSGFKTKGVDRTLLAYSALPENIRHNCHLFIIGKDHAKPYLKQAEKLGIKNKVRFLGGREDAARFLIAADLLIHPAYNENTGTVLLEALVAGLPVLTTDVCGYAKYITDAKAGIVIASPFQQAALNSALHQMLLSPEKLLWQQNGRSYAKKADWYSLSFHAVNIIES